MQQQTSCQHNVPWASGMMPSSWASISTCDSGDLLGIESDLIETGDDTATEARGECGPERIRPISIVTKEEDKSGDSGERGERPVLGVADSGATAESNQVSSKVRSAGERSTCMNVSYFLESKKKIAKEYLGNEHRQKL